MGERQTVVIAMSGGVDSSVAAGLLVERGYRVIGMMLRLWSEPGFEETNRCCTPDAMAQARRVAGHLDIPFYAVDVQKPFREIVVESFLSGYAKGITPNPCLACNRQIRWGLLYEEALRIGADYLATGHYVRRRVDEDGWVTLHRGVDPAKDQSYVLSVLQQEHLRHSLFPVGELTKPEVRELARKWGMIVADRPDSQDLCFLAGRDYRDFLANYAPDTIRSGEIVDPQGKVIGIHQGLANYTIGQRKGLGVSSLIPLYVIAKDKHSNRLIVGQDQLLGRKDFKVIGLNWLDRELPSVPFQADVKIRYKAQEVPAWIQPESDTIMNIHVDEPLRDITPGQQAVFYRGDVCLGGGTISEQEVAG
jgi:tRNA-uridine 2-sulfurtransferase